MSFVEYCEILWRAMELGLVFFTMIWPDELYNVELLPLVRPTIVWIVVPWMILWVIFTSLFFGGPLKDDYLWARAKTQGVAGARRYLELYPKGRSAGDAQVVVLKTERNVSLSVEERYVLLPNHSLGLVKPLSDMLLDSEMRNITVGVEVNGEPLHFSYRRRGKLYTGARLEAAAEVSLCNGNVRLREEFTAETLPPGSVLLKETDNGGKPETGTASIYSDITVFSSRK